MLRFAATIREIVLFGAHPDDIEIGAGGLLLTIPKHIRVRYVLFTGSEARHQEACNAARAFLPSAAIDLTLRSLPDGYLPDHWSAVKDIIQATAAGSRADLILSPSPNDAHQDHRLIGELVPTAFRDTMSLHYELPKWDGDLSQPNLYLPLSDTIARKKAKLLTQSYPSQRDRHWWDDELFLGLARLRGIECHSKYAEAFHSRKTLIGFA